MEKKEYLVEITYAESGEHEVVTIKTSLACHTVV